MRAVSDPFDIHSFGELACLRIHKLAVHEKQALQRDVGGEALLGGEARIRKIENLQIIVQVEAADLAVDRAAGIVRRRNRRTVRWCLSNPDRQRRTKWNRESASASRRWRLKRQYRRLAASFSAFSGRVVRAELVHRREHDLALQLLDRHALLDESRRQVFEKFRIRRPLAHLAEVVGRIHQSRAEMPFPDAVHHDARGQRVRGDVRWPVPAGRCPYRKARNGWSTTLRGNGAAPYRPGCTGCRADSPPCSPARICRPRRGQTDTPWEAPSSGCRCALEELPRVRARPAPGGVPAPTFETQKLRARASRRFRRIRIRARTDPATELLRRSAEPSVPGRSRGRTDPWSRTRWAKRRAEAVWERRPWPWMIWFSSSILPASAMILRTSASKLSASNLACASVPPVATMACQSFRKT